MHATRSASCRNISLLPAAARGAPGIFQLLGLGLLLMIVLFVLIVAVRSLLAPS